MEAVVLPTAPDLREDVASTTVCGHCREAVAMAMVPQILLVFPLQMAAACFHCDNRFLDSVATLLKEILPEDVPDRDGLMERHIEALADLHGTFLQKKYERVLGVFLWQLAMYEYRVSLRKHMQRTLETFADLGTSPEGEKLGQPPGLNSAVSAKALLPIPDALPFAAVIEGPVLDCWSCMRIAAQCFDGELCGVEERHLAEYKEIVLYIFLVCESVLITSVVLV
ncbi:hypothetical protein lerEdw1_009297 [Lerista edwardsae]|nr:hypothetical protein lerEdw1_009297 [Lerista edwardsae]